MGVCLCLCLSLSRSPLYLQGAYKVANFPPWSSLLHVFFQSQHSQGLQKLFFSTSLPQLGNTTQSSRSIPPAKSSFCQHSGSGLSHRHLPQASHPWSICAGIKKGPWQFSWSSRQAPHTRCGLCRLSSRPFCSLSGIRENTSQLPPGSLIGLGMHGPEGDNGP